MALSTRHAPVGVEPYLEQYAAVKPALPGADLPWLVERREEGRARFAALGLPTNRIEDWKYTSLRPLERLSFAPQCAVSEPVARIRARYRHSLTCFDTVQQALCSLLPRPFPRRNAPRRELRLLPFPEGQQDSRLVELEHLTVRIVAEPLIDHIQRLAHSGRALCLQGHIRPSQPCKVVIRPALRRRPIGAEGRGRLADRFQIQGGRQIAAGVPPPAQPVGGKNNFCPRPPPLPGAQKRGFLERNTACRPRAQDHFSPRLPSDHDRIVPTRMSRQSEILENQHGQAAEQLGLDFLGRLQGIDHATVRAGPSNHFCLETALPGRHIDGVNQVLG